jgi:hypothetical protein
MNAAKQCGGAFVFPMTGHMLTSHRIICLVAGLMTVGDVKTFIAVPLFHHLKNGHTSISLGLI